MSDVAAVRLTIALVALGGRRLARRRCRAAADKPKVTVGLIVKRETNPFWREMRGPWRRSTAGDDNVKLLTAAGKSDIDNAQPGGGAGEDDRGGREGHPHHPRRLDRRSCPRSRRRAAPASPSSRSTRRPTPPIGRRRAVRDRQPQGRRADRPLREGQGASRGIEPKIAMLDLAPGITSGELRHEGFLKGFGIKDGDPQIVGSVEHARRDGEGRGGHEARCSRRTPASTSSTPSTSRRPSAPPRALKAAGKRQRRRHPRLGRRRLRRDQERRQAGRDRRHRAAVPGEHGAGGRQGARRGGARRPEAVGLREHRRRADHRRRR